MKSDHKRSALAMSETISATEFKARCLDILDRVGNREVERVAITKRGKVVAVLTPPEAQAEMVKQIWGFMRGSVVIPAEVDLTESVWDEPFAADRGELHG
jgi:prevent-host-death family protein